MLSQSQLLNDPARKALRYQRSVILERLKIACDLPSRLAIGTRLRPEEAADKVQLFGSNKHS